MSCRPMLRVGADRRHRDRQELRARSVPRDAACRASTPTRSRTAWRRRDRRRRARSRRGSGVVDARRSASRASWRRSRRRRGAIDARRSRRRARSSIRSGTSIDGGRDRRRASKRSCTRRRSRDRRRLRALRAGRRRRSRSSTCRCCTKPARAATSIASSSTVCRAERRSSRGCVERGLTRDAARQRLAAQMPADEKAARADFVIDRRRRSATDRRSTQMPTHGRARSTTAR